MKALTIKAPWAPLCVETGHPGQGVKWIETRTRPTKHRGQLYIHVGLDPAPLRDPLAAPAWQVFRECCWGVEREHLVTGAVIGSVDVIDCIPIVGTAEESAIRRVEADTDGSLWLCEAETDPEDLPEGVDPDHDWLDVTDQRPLGDFSHGRWAWIFANPRKCEPVPAKGKLGLWNWDGEA